MNGATNGINLELEDDLFTVFNLLVGWETESYYDSFKETK